MAGMRVLVADDNVSMRRLFERILEQIGKFDVDFAGTGSEALRFYRQKHHDLIIIDNIMPVKTGVDVLRDLRDDPLLDETHVIMVTSEVNKQLVGIIRSEMLKIDDLLVKPIDFEKFKTKVIGVANRVRKKNWAEGPVLKAGERPEEKVIILSSLNIDIIDRGTIAIIEMKGMLSNENRAVVSVAFQKIEGIHSNTIVMDLNSVTDIDEFGYGTLAVMHGWIALNGKEAFLCCDDSAIRGRIAALGLTQLVPEFNRSLNPIE